MSLTVLEFVAGVAAEVRSLTAAKKHTGRDLALLLGVSQQAASAKLRGDTAFTVAELAKVCDWLDTSMDALVERVKGGGQ